MLRPQDISLRMPWDEPVCAKRTTKSTELAIENIRGLPKPPEDNWQDFIPKEYHLYAKVFSSDAALRFPDPRPWDHKIELLSNAPRTLNCKVYPLPPGQQEALDQFLHEHLKKGYICCSNSPYVSPFFFIKKKDGKLQPVQDYWNLNKLTVPNTYPLPLIIELINKLVKKQWFTKFDIQWGYNNVCFKDGDQWKAAFKTNRGLFKPMVMYFSLTNFPATFQTMMDEIFKEELAKGDILIATEGDLHIHKQVVAHILHTLKHNNLFLKPEKCSCHKQEVNYLGFIVVEGQVKMDPV